MAKKTSSKTTAAKRVPKKVEMIYRRLGRTGEKVSVIGLGGYHIGEVKTEAASIRLVQRAIDHGITFMDNCWDYHDGESERRMGKALKGGYRERVFLMSKIDGRTKESAAKQINESLRRFQTDRVDLMQFHEIIRMEDPDRIFEEGGAIEAMVAAQKAGKIRFIGFTGHKDPIVHLRMLDIAARHGFRFDAVQMPINVMDASFRSFENDVLPRLVKERIGVLAMKPMGGGNVIKAVLKDKTASAIDLLHYAMSRPVSVVITGIESPRILNQALEAVRTFEPLSPKRTRKLVKRNRSAAAEGRFERFKTSTEHDGTAENPEWLG